MTAQRSEMHISEFQEQVSAWADHNYGPRDIVKSTLGIAEEVGELCRAVLKRVQGVRGTHEEWSKEIEKELGDVFIKLCEIAGVEGLSLYSVAIERWQDIKQRDFVADPIGHGLPQD